MNSPTAGQRWSSADEALRSHAANQPDALALIEPGGDLTWYAYDALTSLLAEELVERGLQPGDRVGVWMNDGAGVHVALAACNRAGLVAAGVGARSGEAELRHILGRSRAKALISPPEVRGENSAAIFTRLSNALPDLVEHVVLDQLGAPLSEHVTSAGDLESVARASQRFEVRRPEPREMVLINSTSGTTGQPKCVAHDEHRWHKFHEYAVDAAELTPGQVLMSVVPTPFGFGLWSSHFTPLLSGSPCVVLPRFSAELTLQMLEQHRVEVLMAVSTQFIMLLGQPTFASTDLRHLRAMFTGGESVPPHQARLFEEKAGCAVLNFYGSNEAGGLSVTRTRDTQEQRLTTAGRVIEEARVRLFDSEGVEQQLLGGSGQPASKGEIRSLGYLDDDEANRALHTDDGWMLMGDQVTVDPEGYLKVVGRISDIIIRGGKNISAPAVEAEVSTHPAVLRCAAVPVPDDVFGERVCICVVTQAGMTLEFTELLDHLRAREVSIEWLPERMLVLDELPLAAGGKVAKDVLRKQVAALPPSALQTPTSSGTAAPRS